MFFKNRIYSKLKISSQSIGITSNNKHIQCKKNLIFSYTLKEEIKKHLLGRGVSHWEKLAKGKGCTHSSQNKLHIFIIHSNVGDSHFFRRTVCFNL